MNEKSISREVLHNLRQYALLIYITLFSLLLFKFAYLFQHDFNHIMSVASYLTWHNIFEFSGILISIAIFVVSYYSYEQTRNLRSIFLGTVFFILGAVDFFHTLSYKGMPDFFIANSAANRATTFWVIARLVCGIGYLTAAFIPINAKSSIDKRLFVVPATFLNIAVLVVITYFPQVLPTMYVEGTGLTKAKIYSEYFVVVLFLIAACKLVKESTLTKNYLTILFAGSLIFNVFSEIAFISYANVYDIYNYLGHVYKFIANFIIFRIIFINDVKKPYTELSKAQDELRNYAENLDKIVDHRTRQLKQMNNRLLEDLEYARDIQGAMLPRELPDSREISFHAKYFPAERVSGDFYNVVRLDEENIGIYVGDVSGHGVPAAMLTVFVNQSIKLKRESGKGRYRIYEPAEVLRNLYIAYNDTNFKDDVYIVLFYAVYNCRTGKLTYASAGMNVFPLRCHPDGRIEEIEIRGFPICKFMEPSEVAYSNTEITLNPGEKLFLYTDGLSDAVNDMGERYSTERVMEVLSNSFRQPGEELVDSVVRSMFGFIDTSKLKDDISFIVMDIKENL